MKYLLFPVALSVMAIAGTGCNGTTQNQPAQADSIKASNDTMDVLQTTEVDVPLKSSDVHFDAALVEFSKNDLPASAKDIRDGIASFKKETASDTGATKLMAEAAIKNLDGLDMKVEKGDVKDVTILENAFNKADDANLHREFVSVTDIFIPEKQASMKDDFSKAVANFKTAVARDKGKMKADGEKIVKKGEAIQSKLNNGAKATEKEIKEFNSEAKTWLQTHI